MGGGARALPKGICAVLAFAVFVLPLFEDGFTFVGGGVRAIEAIPKGIIGDRSEVPHLVEEVVAVFAAVGLHQPFVGFAFIVADQADHDEVGDEEDHQVEEGLSPVHDDLARGGVVEDHKVALATEYFVDQKGGDRGEKAADDDRFEDVVSFDVSGFVGDDRFEGVFFDLQGEVRILRVFVALEEFVGHHDLAVAEESSREGIRTHLHPGENADLIIPEALGSEIGLEIGFEGGAESVVLLVGDGLAFDHEDKEDELGDLADPDHRDTAYPTVLRSGLVEEPDRDGPGSHTPGLPSHIGKAPVSVRFGAVRLKGQVRSPEGEEAAQGGIEEETHDGEGGVDRAG